MSLSEKSERLFLLHIVLFNSFDENWNYMKLEICAINLESAIAAQNGGADRIELCDNIVEGGTTPSYGIIKLAIDKLSIPINVLIRPRAGDFLYTELEFQSMREDIIACRGLGVNGVVLGVLKVDGSVDVKRVEELVNLAKPMEVTFHRAFDMTYDIYEALEDVIATGASRILTSGGAKKAELGIEVIKGLVSKSEGRISIMPGSGVNMSNLSDFISLDGINELHLSAKDRVFSKMEFIPSNLAMSGGTFSKDNYHYVSDENQIIEIVKYLHS